MLTFVIPKKILPRNADYKKTHLATILFLSRNVLNQIISQVYII